ncbi:DNA ligase 4 [Sistotremastrum niveocremeum HHB9708]|uniref:DNA ligase n=1 Tax=Sistotremastrum niveocremeum HHB9708 TaxID=1314777 RepID=A0A164VTC7_9AGAM|nr:DNA ligase 4 [Sistotremastrum niveocremeum HHB9708]
MSLSLVPKDIDEPEAPPEDEIYNPPPPNHGPSPAFKHLTRLFERLQGERRLDKRSKMLELWFKNYREGVGNNFYDVLRLLLPQKDRERAVYQVKEKNLAKLFIRAIPLGPSDPDAQRLMHWKKPAEDDKVAGDFPTVLFEVLSKRSSVMETTLTIAEVNAALDELAEAAGKMDKQMSSIQLFYNRCTPTDQRWIIRIILKDLLISVKDTTVFAVFHPDAQALFNTCSDLKKVAFDLWDINHTLHPDEKNVQLFKSFAPMLCKRPLHDIEDSVKKMGGIDFFIEEKLDGERIQLHKRGNEYFYCSRKGKDYTYLYGKHVGEGGLTPFIHGKAFHPDAESLILDGEMLVFDPDTESYLPFGNLKGAAMDKSKTVHKPRPCFKVFDILMINGKSLIDRSTVSRKENLRHTVIEVKGHLEYASEWIGKTSKDVRERMEEVMNARGEGLVIKHMKARYILNGRNEDWIKVKPEYLDNMGETVDVLVTGGNYGSGKRGGGVSTLVCAVRDDSVEGEEPKYRTFVRIGSGLTFADYVEIRSRPWKPYDKNRPPPWLLSAPKGLEDKPDVYLEPQDSFILKVKAAQITPTDQYHMGLTMRFPRALIIRDDLTIADCATASDIFESLRSEKKRKIDEASGTTSKRRKLGPKFKTLTLAHNTVPEDIDSQESKSSLFSGMKFYILLEGKPTPNTVATQRKHDLQRLIVSHGGDFTAGYKHDPSILILYGGETKPAPVSMIIRAGERDIIRTRWISDCVKRQTILPLKEKYLFFATESRRRDPAFDELDPEDTDTVLYRMPSEGPQLFKKEETEDVPLSSSNSERDAGQCAASSGERTVDSETDPDSDFHENEDDADPDRALFGGDEAATSKVAGEVKEETPELSKPAIEESQSVAFGETKDAAEYDQENIFRHLCFYLDTAENAVLNQLRPNKQTVTSSLGGLTDKILSNGGTIVKLDDPKLTHVIFDPEETGRRLEIRRRVCKGIERYLIVSDWVDACIEDGTLVDERMFDA